MRSLTAAEQRAVDEVRTFLGPQADNLNTSAILLAGLIRRHVPDLGKLLGPSLEELWLPRMLYFAATGDNAPFCQLERTERLCPENPLTIGPDGGVHGAELATLEHLQQLRNYYAALRPAKPGEDGGRPVLS